MSLVQHKIGARKSALLVVDMQNDFLHEDGAYARGSARSDAAIALPARLAPVADAFRSVGAYTVATLFTLIPDAAGDPMIANHLRQLRPFLRRGDFAPGGWGQRTVEGLGTFSTTVEKVAFSAFYMTRLEYVLKRAGIEHLVIGGIVTNGGVASTARDAHVRDFAVTVLSDGCAAPTPKIHDDAIADLGNVVAITTCHQVIQQIKGE
jgi:ureidoacrylate peracid hydrolase